MHSAWAVEFCSRLDLPSMVYATRLMDNWCLGTEWDLNLVPKPVAIRLTVSSQWNPIEGSTGPGGGNVKEWAHAEVRGGHGAYELRPRGLSVQRRSAPQCLQLSEPRRQSPSRVHGKASPLPGPRASPLIACAASVRAIGALGVTATSCQATHAGALTGSAAALESALSAASAS